MKLSVISSVLFLLWPILHAFSRVLRHAFQLMGAPEPTEQR